MFDFGKNWEEFSANALTEEKLETARKSLADLLGGDSIEGKEFLDIGCGTGLFGIAAAKLKAASVTGIDANERCISLSKKNTERFAPEYKGISFMVASILDRKRIEDFVNGFDIVYAWGSLHHTGNMKEAITIASRTVKQDGLFVIAIYNKHFTSIIWKYIKRVYNISPRFIKGLMVYFFAIIIFVAKWLVTGKNPFEQRRGMDFYYNVIDWVGGYPYEYASRDEIVSLVTGLGFSLKKFIPAHVPTGCNEYVFWKKPQ